MNPPARILAAAAFLAEAHRHGFHGPEGLRRWAMRKNAARRSPAAYIPTELVDAAVALERAQSTEPESLSPSVDLDLIPRGKGGEPDRTFPSADPPRTATPHPEEAPNGPH